MSVKDYTKQINRSVANPLQFTQNPSHLPQHPFRMLVLGQTGCGKSNLLLNFLLDDSDVRLNYTHVWLCCKDPTEPTYEFLTDYMAQKEEKIRAIAKKKKIDLPPNFSIFDIVTDLDSLPEVNDIDKDDQHIIIFDDFAIDSDQERIKEYFIRGRKRNASLIYLSQGFRDVPKVIRDQMRYTALFRPAGGTREISSLAQSLAGGIDSREFKRLVVDCTSGYDFMFIDNNAKDKSHKFRKGFTGYSEWHDE